MLVSPMGTLYKDTFSTKEGITRYKNALESLDCDSPYYAFELLNDVTIADQELSFFIFETEASKLTVVMPFLLRKIRETKSTETYYDVSSPWGYNGPYFSATISEQEILEFWKQVDAWYVANNVVTEFLRFNLHKNYKLYSGTALHTLCNVMGDITNWELFWGNLKSNTRNQYRKAEKLGLTFELHYKDIAEEHVKAFHDLYIGTMNRREARDSFYLSLEYFITLWKENPTKCAIGLVYKDGLPISTELFLLSSNTIFSFLGGTNSDYFKLRPNEYLKISAIKWANEEGLKYYLIGGGLSNSKEDNLYLYKKKYFPLDEDVDFYTGRKIVNTEVYERLVKESTLSEASTAPKDITTGFFPAYRK